MGNLWKYGRHSGFGYPISNNSAVVAARDPDTVRGPDVAFYSHARWPQTNVGLELPLVPPDVAIEVVSPGNRAGQISTKVAEYQAAKTLMIWVVYPASRSVVIHRSDAEPPMVLQEDAVIENLPELPDFRSPVADFFA